MAEVISPRNPHFSTVPVDIGMGGGGETKLSGVHMEGVAMVQASYGKG